MSTVILTVVAMLYFYVFMLFDGYYAIGAAFSATTLVMMLVFCFTVHEKKFKADSLHEEELAAEQDRIESSTARSKTPTARRRKGASFPQKTTRSTFRLLRRIPFCTCRA